MVTVQTLKLPIQHLEDGCAYVYAEEKALAEVSETLAAYAEALRVKAGDVVKMLTVENGKKHTLLFARLPETLDYDSLEALTAAFARKVREEKLKSVQVALLNTKIAELSEAFYKQLALSNNTFTTYQKTGFAPLKKDGNNDEKEVPEANYKVTLDKSFDLEAEKKKLKAAQIMANGIIRARYLVNEPANVMTPERLASEAKRLGEETGFSVEVFDEKQIQEMGMQAFWSVAKGSDTPPRFIVMRYMNNPDSQKVLALIGKGLTYDSGGYALKPADGMGTMFCDMGGAAAAICAMGVLAKSKARVNVVGIVAACENMLSGHAYRNGDIIGSLSGKHIEIVNTDAEGRLTLADAITYAATVIKADMIIEAATLTGAVSIALGKEITGFVGDNEEIWNAVQEASEKSGDKVWRLPNYAFLEKSNKSDRADIKNSGGRLAGTATAALFCRAFAFGVPWGHLDIAATAYHDAASDKAPFGATGVGVELFSRAAVKLFEE